MTWPSELLYAIPSGTDRRQPDAVNCYLYRAVRKCIGRLFGKEKARAESAKGTSEGS